MANEIIWWARCLGDAYAAIMLSVFLLYAMLYGAGQRRDDVKNPIVGLLMPIWWGGMLGLWFFWLRPLMTGAMA